MKVLFRKISINCQRKLWRDDMFCKCDAWTFKATHRLVLFDWTCCTIHLFSFSLQYGKKKGKMKTV